jgi:hypothetical protein
VFSRARRSAIVRVLAPAITTSMVVLAFAAPPSLSGCNEGTPNDSPAAVPTIGSVDLVVAKAERNDAGESVGGCCVLSVRVTFQLVPDEFIRHAFIEWPGVGNARFEYFPLPDVLQADAGNDPSKRVLSIAADVPPVLVTRGAKLPLSVVLVTGRGVMSVPGVATAVLD